MTFQYLFGEADTYIQAALLLVSLIFAVMGTVSDKVKKIRNIYDKESRSRNTIRDRLSP